MYPVGVQSFEQSEVISFCT